MDTFYIIVGLGNPGKQYDGTRHNIGFDVIDSLIDRYHISGPARFGQALTGKGVIAGRKVILVKPLTYMNRSGEAVQNIVNFYKTDPSTHLLVISDDIDLDEGVIRMRKKGSAGGHNGLKDIIRCLGTDGFSRLRVGVGDRSDRRADLAGHVLGHFSAQDRKVMDEAVDRAAQAVACYIVEGPDIAMNRFNTPRARKETAE